MFAYGSLMWRPEPTFEGRCRAYLRDYKRDFCVYAVYNRGTPTRRGLVLGVIPSAGGHVEGVAYRVSGQSWDEAYSALIKREQAGAAYKECWLYIRLETEAYVPALVFVADHRQPTWAGDLTEPQRLHLLATASGKMGSNADYAFLLEQELTSFEITDNELSRLIRELRAMIHPD